MGDKQETKEKPKTIRGRCWLGTWQNYPEDWATIIKSNADDFVAQLEKGEETEKLHVQFAVKFKEHKTLSSLQKMFKGAHLEKAINWAACKNYCRKDKTAEGERIDNTLKFVAVRDPLEGKELRPIQKEIIDIVNTEPDDRTVHWFYDPKGSAGKTTVAKHLCIKRGDVIYVAGKSADMKFGVQQFVRKYDIRAVIMDYTRSTEGFVSYQGIEEIKNGIFYSGKYESGMVLFNNPHVIILSNFLPDLNALSFDRWNIHDYSEENPSIPEIPEVFNEPKSGIDRDNISDEDLSQEVEKIKRSLGLL